MNRARHTEEKELWETMRDYESISHTRYECKYHIVFIPKYRKKKLYGRIRRELGQELRRLAGHMMADHIHMLMSIPPKHSVSQVVGYIKGKSAIWIARSYGERQRYFSGQHMWARGYFVSTVGLDEEVIREYIKTQEDDDRKQDELFD